MLRGSHQSQFNKNHNQSALVQRIFVRTKYLSLNNKKKSIDYYFISLSIDYLQLNNIDRD